jgi:hypothetical protein
MPQYWLKPVGVTRDPFAPVPRDYLANVNHDDFRMMTGPSIQSQPPQMGRGDRVLFHAVHYVRLIADGEILANPDWVNDERWGIRWPWVYPTRIDVWVPDVESAPKSSGLVPTRAIGRISAGGEYAKLTRAEYEAARDALVASPASHQRE